MESRDEIEGERDRLVAKRASKCFLRELTYLVKVFVYKPLYRRSYNSQCDSTNFQTSSRITEMTIALRAVSFFKCSWKFQDYQKIISRLEDYDFCRNDISDFVTNVLVRVLSGSLETWDYRKRILLLWDCFVSRQKLGLDLHMWKYRNMNCD